MSQQGEFHDNSNNPIYTELHPSEDERRQRRNSLLYDNADLSHMNSERKASIDATIESIASKTAVNTRVNVLGLEHADNVSTQYEVPVNVDVARNTRDNEIQLHQPKDNIEVSGGRDQALYQEPSDTERVSADALSRPDEAIQNVYLQQDSHENIEPDHDKNGIHNSNDIEENNFSFPDNVHEEASAFSQQISAHQKDSLMVDESDSAVEKVNSDLTKSNNENPLSLSKEEENNDMHILGADDKDNLAYSGQNKTVERQILESEEISIPHLEEDRKKSDLLGREGGVNSLEDTERENHSIKPSEGINDADIQSGSLEDPNEKNIIEIEKLESNVQVETNLGEQNQNHFDLQESLQNEGKKSHNEPEKLPWEEPDVTNMQESLPWEEKKDIEVEEILPWEEKQDIENKESLPLEEKQNAKHNEILPREEQQDIKYKESLLWEENQVTKDQESLPSEANQDTEHQELLSWEENQGTEYQETLASKDNKQLEKLPWEENLETKDQVTLPLEDNQETKGKETLPWEDNKEFNARGNLPWEENQDEKEHESLPWEVNQYNELQENLPLEDKESENLPWEEKQPGAHENFPWESNTQEVEPASNSKSDINLDTLLDDHDFIETEVKGSKKKLDINQSSNKDIDLDLDDDLLLDDEFLEEEPLATPIEVNPQPEKYNTNKNKPKRFDLQTFENLKKKSDAYDFPSDLVTPRAKPASRTNKYSSGTNKPYFSPVQKKDDTNSQRSSRTSSEVTAKLLPVKPFFDELPIDLTKVTKAARAAPVKTLNQNPIGNALPQTNSSSLNQAAPVNPYAKLSKPLTHNSSASAVPAPVSISNNLVTPATRNNQYAPFPQLSPISTKANFSTNTNPSQLSASHSIIGRKISNPSPNLTNANLTKQQPNSATSGTSPYVPNTGPYAPSSRRSHARSSSLIGGKGKEVNPYVPISTNPNVNPAQNHTTVPPPTNNLTHGMPPPKVLTPTSTNNITRPRKVSNPRPSIYSKSHSVQRTIDPNAAFHKQFPIFTWSNSQNVVSLVPSIQANAYNKQQGEILIKNISETIDSTQFSSFPGPLNKMSKKKDVEKWLETRIEYFNNINNVNEIEVMMNRILLVLIKYNVDMKSKDLIKEICSILNPNVDYFSDVSAELTSNAIMISNASRLDSAGINIVFNLIQVGNIDRALEYAISRGDWAISLVMANIVGEEKFNKIVSDYSRFSFPFQKSNNKVHHLMPILLKMFAGSVKGVIDDFNNIQTEKEWALLHWREIIALSLILDSPKSLEFILEFGKLLAYNGNIDAATISFMLCGRPLSQLQSSDNVQFSVIQMSILYTEIYEYILSIVPNSTQAPFGFPHLLPVKLKHASLLADYGNFSESQKYIDLVNNMIKSFNKSPFVNAALISEFQNLIIRVSDTGNMEQGWFSGKISKVNLDKVWGQIDKFIGGDEPSTKNNEGGVFSKFSPSISRTTSTLDFTVTPANFPPQIPTLRRDSLPVSAENQFPSYGRSKSSMAPYSSSLAGSKYSNQAKGVISATQQTQNNDSYSAVPIVKYVHSNSSSQSLPTKDNFGNNDNELQKRYPSKYNPVLSKDIDVSKGYTNSSGQNPSFSDLNQPHPHVTNGQSAVKGPSVASVNSTDFSNMDAIRKLNHSPSLQSDISLDFPSEFRTVSKRDTVSLTNSQSVQEEGDSPIIRKANTVGDTINELETKPGNYYSNNANGSAGQQALTNKAFSQQTEDHNLPMGPPSIPATSTIRSPKRINPYAPRSSTNKQENRKGKYGPSSTSRMKYSSQSSHPVTEEVPQLNISDKPYSMENTVKGPEASRTSVISNSETIKKDELNTISHERETYFEQPYTNLEMNRDNFSKGENEVEEPFDENPASTPERRKSLFLKDNQSPTDPEKPSMFNPYNKTKKEVTSVLDTSFGEFSIPGSPEYTTRANSVFGGPSLFTSRLSESHQSALYQQYEVRDDTVRDYIPPVEEEEEEEEEEVVSVKEKESEKERIEKDNTDENFKKGGSSTDSPAKGSLFSWFSKNDGKPRPTRANLGEENMFYYSEEHKRYINRNIPIEDQIKDTKPLPPPIAKKSTPVVASLSNAPPSRSTTSEAPLIPAVPGQEKKGDQLTQDSLPPPMLNAKSGTTLANAGLEDLLSLGGSSSSLGTGRKSRRGARRGYVNVMEQK